MRKLSAALSVFVLTTALTPSAFAKHDGGKDKDKTHQLVDQIIDAVQAEQKLSDDELAELKKKQQDRMNRIIDVISDKAQISDEEKAKLKEKIMERIATKKAEQQKNQLPPELKEQIEAKLDLKNFSKQTTYQVLADHLDNSDLKAILKFLKSPTGQKLFREGPDMIGEVVELSAEKYLPMIIELSKRFKTPHGVPKDLPPGLSPKDTNPEHQREILEKWKKFMQEHMPQRPPLTGPGKDET